MNKANLVVQQSLAAGQRIRYLMTLPVEVQDLPGASEISTFESAIRFEEVSFRTTIGSPDRRLTRDPRGQVVAFVGPSGGGKTTLVNLLPRFFDATAGRVTVDGRDVRSLRLASLRGLIGLVTQETVLFDDTVRNNIAYGRGDLPLEQVRAAARAARADEFVLELAQGYDTMVGEGGVRLSGGQRQRLAIARALLKDAPILILDEATSQLDSESESWCRRRSEPDAGAHHAGDRAPPVDDQARRPHLRARRRAHRGGRHPRPAARARRHLPQTARAAVRGLRRVASESDGVPGARARGGLRVALVAALAAGFLRALRATVRMRFHREATIRAWERGEQHFLLAFWHRHMLLMRFAYRGRRMTVLASRSRDGELMSRVLGRLGIDTSRGSTTRGGAMGLRDLVRRARAGSDLGSRPTARAARRGRSSPARCWPPRPASCRSSGGPVRAPCVGVAELGPPRPAAAREPRRGGLWRADPGPARRGSHRVGAAHRGAINECEQLSRS